MTELRLVHGGDAAAREAAIARHLRPGATAVALLEGLASDTGLEPSDTLQVIRIAPGCPCCTGNLTMQVTLNRVLRHPPATLFLSLADASHLESIRSFLQQEQYCVRLMLGPDLNCALYSDPVQQSGA